MRLYASKFSLLNVVAVGAIALSIPSTTIAQSADHCTLAGNYIELDDSEISFSLNAKNTPKATPVEPKKNEEDDFFGDGVSGSGESGGCEGGGMSGAIRCQVTQAIKDARDDQEAQARRPSGVIVDNSDDNENWEEPNEETREEVVEDFSNTPSSLEGSKATITVPVKRFLLTGDPARIYTVPAGAPKLTSNGPLTPGDMGRLQQALKANLAALGKTPHVVSSSDLGQLYADGSGYQIGLTPPDSESLLTYAPTSAGGKLPAECVSLVKGRAELDRLLRESSKKARECNTLTANIKSRKKPAKDDNIFEKGWISFLNTVGADDAINRMESRLGQCKKDLAALRKSSAELKAQNAKRLEQLREDQHARDIAAIKADPKTLAQEEKIREARAIGKRAAMEEHLAKMQKGMNLYNKNMQGFDDMIRTLEAQPNSPETDAKLKLLKTERQRYNDSYSSWLERMTAIADTRERDFNREIKENAKDGIGPASYKQLRDRLSARGLNPTQVINEKFGESLKYAERQAARDRVTLGGDTTTGQSTGELLGEVVKDYYTMSPAERLRRLRTYGPDALQGIGEGTVEGVEGLYKLGKGVVDLVPEAAGYEGFEGSTTGFLVKGGDKLADSFTRGTDGRANTKDRFDNFNSNLGKFMTGVDDKFNRSLEQLAGSGEKGTKEAVRKFAKGGTMIAGGEMALMQSASKLNGMFKVMRGMDVAADGARAGDLAADGAKLSDTSGDAARVSNAADVRRAADAGADATRSTPPLDDATRTTPPLDDATRTTPPLDDATRTTPPSDGVTKSGSGDLVNPRDVAGPSYDLGQARKYSEGSKSRQTQDLLEAAGADSQAGRVAAARAGERSVNDAVAAGIYETGVAPKTLIDKGLATADDIRSGMTNYLDELSIPKGEQGAIIDRVMDRVPGENAWTPKPVAQTGEAVGEAGRATQRLPEAVASGADGAKATQRLPEAAASGADGAKATQRLPEAVASGSDGAKATQRLPEAVASGADGAKATQRLPEAVASGADGAKATQRLPEAAASGADGAKATQRLPEAVASGADGAKATQRLPEAVASGADGAKATQRLPEAVASGAEKSIGRNAGRFSREELARRVNQPATDGAKATQRLPEAVASGADGAKATQRLPEAVASGADGAKATQRLPEAVASGADGVKATRRLPEAVASGADGAKATQRLPEAVASGADGAKATQRLPEAVASGADGARATQRLPQPAASTGARATEAATQGLAQPVTPVPTRAADATQKFGRVDDIDPIIATARKVEDGIELTHAGRKIKLNNSDKLGEGVTSSVYGRDGKPVAVKLSADDIATQALDDLGRAAMQDRLPIPEVHKRYRLGPDSQLPTREGPTGGMMSIVDKAPDSFQGQAAKMLEQSGAPKGAQRATMPAAESEAILAAAKKMTDDGFVLGDLKPDNFAFRKAEDLTHGRELEFVPLDDGMVIKLQDKFKHMAAEIQDVILNPGEVFRNLSDDIALSALRGDLSQYDHMIDWVAMNGGRLDGPFNTLGAGSGALPYTPSLGVLFRGLSK